MPLVNRLPPLGRDEVCGAIQSPSGHPPTGFPSGINRRQYEGTFGWGRDLRWGGLAPPPDPPAPGRGLPPPRAPLRQRSPVSLEYFSSYGELLQAPRTSVSAIFGLQKSPKKFHTFLKLIFFTYFKPWDPSHLLPHAQNTSSHALPNS